MVKHFLIDGYNLAHKLYTIKNNLQLVRDKVQRLVSNYAMQKKCKATIVFDGKWNLDTVEHYSNVTVIFTASGEIADTRIKKMIDETPNKSSLCVVSSDGEILRYAKVSCVQSITSEEFITKLKPPNDPSNPTDDDDQKPDGPDLGDIDSWKKLFE